MKAEKQIGVCRFASKMICHCEERSDVAIPRLEGKCSELHHE